MDPAGWRRNRDSDLVCDAFEGAHRKCGGADDYCRKVKCEKLEGRKMVCIYRGQNNTIESQFFGYGEFVPQRVSVQV